MVHAWYVHSMVARVPFLHFTSQSQLLGGELFHDLRAAAANLLYFGLPKYPLALAADHVPRASQDLGPSS